MGIRRLFPDLVIWRRKRAANHLKDIRCKEVIYNDMWKWTRLQKRPTLHISGTIKAFVVNFHYLLPYHTGKLLDNGPRVVALISRLAKEL